MDRHRFPAIYASVWGVFWFGLDSLRAWALFAGAFDLGHFVQALGRLFGSGNQATFTGFGFFDDHFSPLSVPLAPLVSGSVAPFALLGAQAIAASVSVLLVYKLSHEVTGDRRKATLLMIAYSMAPPLLYALWFDFHPPLLGLPFLVLLLLGIERGETKAILIGATGLSLAREDMALLCAIVLLVSFRRMSRHARWSLLIPPLVMILSLIVVSNYWFLRQGLVGVGSAEGVRRLVLIGEGIWAGGFLVLLLGALLTPWLILRIAPTRSLLAAAIWAAPLVLLPFTYTKYPGFHYYAVIPALMVEPAARASMSTSHWMPRWYVGVAMAIAFGPLGISAFAPGTPTVSDVITEFAVRGPTLMAIRGFDDCLSGVGIRRSVAEQIVPLAPPESDVTPWPLPFRPYRSNETLEPSVPDGGSPSPEVTLKPGYAWDRNMAYIDEGVPLSELGYLYLGDFGPGLIELWSLPSAEGVVAGCLSEYANEQVFAPGHR